MNCRIEIQLLCPRFSGEFPGIHYGSNFDLVRSVVGVNSELVRLVVQILVSSEPKNFEKFKNEDNFLIFRVGPNFSMLKIILSYLPKILIRNKKFIFGYSIL